MKKLFSILLASAILLSSAACSTVSPTPSDTVNENPSVLPSVSQSESPTPSPSQEPELPTPTPIPVSDSVKKLGDYIIIYPNEYENPRQMKEVELLQNVIEKLSGKRPSTQKDTDGELTNKNYIIFASSTVKTSQDKVFNELLSEMDYAICFDDDNNVILGGKTYYSDMRAAYDFINNYLGYDDIEDEYSEPEKGIGEDTVYAYTAPTFIVAAHNAWHPAFTPKVVKEACDCHINLMTYNLCSDQKYWIEDDYKALATWCVRFGIYFMADAYISGDNEVTIKSEEFMLKNPMLYGVHLRDEPGENDLPTVHKQVESFNLKYSEYNLKCYINHFYSGTVWDSLENNGYLSNSQITGFDRYARNYNLSYTDWLDYVDFLKRVKRVSDNGNIDFWMYLESYKLMNKGETIYTDKTFRFTSYLAMCFGAKGINYFCYADLPYYNYEGDWSHGQLLESDFTPTKAWHHAQSANEDILKFAEIYNQYNNIGAYMVGKSSQNDRTEENRYTGCDDILVDFLDKKGNEVTDKYYLVGCFDKNEGDGKAFLILNLDKMNSQAYTTTRGQKVKLKINGENVKFYQDGEIINVETDENGYYTPIIANGTAIFVTVD